MKSIKQIIPGILIAALLAILSSRLSRLIHQNLISGGVFALLIGMLLNPLVSKYEVFQGGIAFTSKVLLRLAIILMGLSLSFTQVFEVGKYSIIVMIFTLFTAFGGGYIFGKLFNMRWQLSGLISAGTGICGGSAIAAIAPVIEAEDSDIAYAISATFIFDIIMVILFPLMGRYFNMSDLGFGLWAGTAVNDTSSVVAAGYAFSDIAGNFSVIVKLTRTLSIVPVVLIFSYINQRISRRESSKISFENNGEAIIGKRANVSIQKIFPWFILMFLGMVVLKSIGIVPQGLSQSLSNTSKFFMIMALGAIGLRTNFSKLSNSGFRPMVHGFIISALVVIVSFLVQMSIGQI